MLFNHKLVKHEEVQEKVNLYLAPGQLVIMAGVTQQC